MQRPFLGRGSSQLERPSGGIGKRQDPPAVTDVVSEAGGSAPHDVVVVRLEPKPNLLQEVDLDLSHTFSRDAEPLANLVQGFLGLASVDTPLEHHAAPGV